MTHQPKWRRFENLVAAIHRDLAPQNAVVSQNEYILGRHSGVPRQIDIAVRVSTPAGTLLLVVDAKDHARKLDVKEVEAFLGMVDDVGANRGAIISPVGFSEAARRRAQSAGVDAWTALDVESVDWPAQLTIPVLIDHRSPVYRFQLSFSQPISVAIADITTMDLFDAEGCALGTPMELAIGLWESDQIDSDNFHEQRILLRGGKTFIRNASSQFDKLEVSLVTRVESAYFLGNVDLAQMRGLAGPAQTIDGRRTVRTRGFTTDWISFAEVQTRWRRLASPEEVTVKPVLAIVSLAVLSEQLHAGS